MATATVNFIGSAAPLLSSSVLSECQNAKDSTCRGGVAAVAAHARRQTVPTLVLPRLDRSHEFVQSHPLGWNVNTRVLQEHFGWKAFTANPELLTEQETGRDVSGLQTPDMPLLMTNVAIPPSNSWHPYVESVHLDPVTKLALISLEDESDNSQLGWSQVDSALATLDYIAALNRRTQCGSGDKQELCWTPIILVYSSSKETFDRLVTATIGHENPPALIVDWEGTQPAYGKTKPTVLENDVWITSQALTEEKYLQYTITVDLATQRIQNLNVTQSSLLELPPNYKDEAYAKDISFLRSLADEAMSNDPALANSNAMPRADTGQCKRQECEVGNLVADSLRWKTRADVGFFLGQDLAGPGWSFGQIRVSNIFETLPTPTTICTGKISGKALIKILDHSLKTDKGSSPLDSRFLQVSGLQVIYNDQSQSSTKLVSLKVWDHTVRAFLDLNPLRLYEFATTKELCQATNSPYASFLEADDDVDAAGNDNFRIGSALLQNAVGDYLRNFKTTYVPTLDDRIKNDRTATTVLDLSAGACTQGSFWESEQQSCLSCPSSRSYVSLSDTRVDFKFQNNTMEPQIGRIVVVNRDLHDFVLSAKHVPEWFEFTAAKGMDSSFSNTVWPDAPMKLASGEQIAFDYAINATKLGVGITYDTVYFNVADYDPIPSCNSEPHALALDALIQVTPPNRIVDLGQHAIIGLAIMGLTILITAGLGLWVYLERSRWGYGNLGAKQVKSIQPLYLGTICFGVFIMALTIGGMSLDEGLMSGESSFKTCLISPWLLSLGITLIFSALLSKLTTAVKMAERPNERTVQVSYMDLIKPFIFLLISNFAILFLMLIDPPSWEQEGMESEDWKFYGFCHYGVLSSSLLIASGLLHFSTLCYTCYQTYKASSVSPEVKDIGLALFLWFQIIVIALPAWFTIDHEDIVGKYYFRVVVISVMSLAMLLSIFVPVMISRQIDKRGQQHHQKGHYRPGTPRHRRVEPEKVEESPSIFGGFLGFNQLAGSVAGSGPRYSQQDIDEEVHQEEQTRCLPDRFCS